MTKSTTIIFVLGFALILNLEKKVIIMIILYLIFYKLVIGYAK